MNQQIQSQWTFWYQNIILVNQNLQLHDSYQGKKIVQQKWTQKIRQQQKKIIDESIEKYLDIKKKEDYLIRVSQIVRIFDIDPSSIGSSQMVSQQLNFYLKKKKELSSFQLNSCNQRLFFAQYLYERKQIIIKVKIWKNQSQTFLDLLVFDKNGQILAIFSHNQKLQKIINSFNEKFRNIKRVFWIEKTHNKTINLENFVTFYQNFKQQDDSEMFAIFQDDSSNKQSISNNNIKVSNLLINQIKFIVCSNKSITILNRQNTNLSQSKINEVCSICSSYEKFQKMFQQSAHKIQLLQKNSLVKSSIFIRLTALYFNSYSKYKNTPLDKNLINQLHKTIIIELMKAKKQFMEQKIQNTKIIDCHFPARLSSIGSIGKICVYCRKKKTNYKCVGCSANFEKSIPLCVLCFLGYHSKQNNGSYAPKLPQKEQIRDRQSLRLYQIKANSSTTSSNPPTKLDPIDLCKKLQISQEGLSCSQAICKKFIHDSNVLIMNKNPKQLDIFKAVSKKIKQLSK